MAVTKDNLKLYGSNFLVTPTMRKQPTYYHVTNEDIADPGRIALKHKLPHRMWKIILRMNGYIDGIDEMEPGHIIAIPKRDDIQRLRKV